MEDESKVRFDELDKRLASAEKRFDDIKWYFGGVTGVFMLVFSLLTIILSWNYKSERDSLREFQKNVKAEFGELLKDREEIKKVAKDSLEFDAKMQRFRDNFVQLSSLQALVLNIGRIKQELPWSGDEIEHFKNANIEYAANRKIMLYYIASANYDEYNAEVIAEALNTFLKLIYFSNDNITSAEKDEIFNACRWCLNRIDKRDFRYRLKSRDNLILFGQILKKRNPDYYAAMLIPSLGTILNEPEFADNMKFTVAEALAALGEGGRDVHNILVAVMKDDKISFYNRNSAAVGLVYLKDQRGRDYLFTQMEPHRSHSLMAALALGEAVARSDAIKLDMSDRQRLINRIIEGISHTYNQFQKDYAEAILKRLKENGKLGIGN